MKKVLSLVLVIAMVLSSMSFAFASTFEDVTGDYEKAIDTLAGLGIITGYEDGTYRPEKVVTRAEMAKLMVEILGYGDLVSGAKSNFTDTQGHWADQWIAIAAGRNIVIGTGNGKFAPDRTVSYDEVLTMIVRGLGYTDDSNEIKSMTWPTNFKVKAAEIGVTDGVKMSASGADRGGVAQALFNALKATLVTVDNEGNVKVLQDQKQRDQKLITRIAKEVGTEDAPLRILPKHLDPNDKAYAGDIVDLAPYLYEYVEAYASKSDSDIIVYVGDSFSETVKGTFVANHPSGVTTPNYKFDVDLEDGSTETLDLTTTDGKIEVYYNGKEVKLNESDLENGIANKVVGLDATGVADVKVVLKDKDYNDDKNIADGDVEAIVVNNPTFAQKIVSEYKTDSLKLGRIQLPKKGDKVDLSKVTVTGAVEDIKDIKSDDLVVVYAAGGADNSEVPSKVELVVVRNTVEGTVTKVKANSAGEYTTIYIDDVKYTRSEIPGRTETFDVGYEGTFFLDDAGNLFAADATDIASAKDYAVVIEAEPGYKANATTGRILADATIKLINASGEVVTLKVDEDAKYVDGNKGKILSDSLGFVSNGSESIVSSALIKYRLEDNEITGIEIVKQNPLDNSNPKTVDTDSSKFEVADGAPIFSIKNVGSTSKDDYSVVKVENLPSTIKVQYSEYTDNGQYKVIVSSDADRSVSGTYALITEVTSTVDGTTRVAEIKGYVDGNEVTYLGKYSRDTVYVDNSLVNKGKIVKLELSGGKVKDAVTSPVNSLIATPSALYVSSDSSAVLKLKYVSDNTDYGTDFDIDVDNLVIYVLKSDNKFDYVEDNVKNIKGREVVGLYTTDTNNNDIEIIVVK